MIPQFPTTKNAGLVVQTITQFEQPPSYLTHQRACRPRGTGGTSSRSRRRRGRSSSWERGYVPDRSSSEVNFVPSGPRGLRATPQRINARSVRIFGVRGHLRQWGRTVGGCRLPRNLRASRIARRLVFVSVLPVGASRPSNYARRCRWSSRGRRWSTRFFFRHYFIHQRN